MNSKSGVSVGWQAHRGEKAKTGDDKTVDAPPDLEQVN